MITSLNIILFIIIILISIISYIIYNRQKNVISQKDLDYRVILSEKEKLLSDITLLENTHLSELEELGKLADEKLDRTIKAYDDKLNEAEKIIEGYEKTFVKIDTNIRLSESKIKEIDAKGIFQSDDEIGWFFTGIKQIQENLNRFKIEHK